jgi:nitrate reductase NapE component
MGNLKWRWIDESYKSLKKNYERILDKQDVEEAFSHDEPIKMAKKQFKGFRFRMICLWAVLIIGMVGFIWILHKNH